MKKRNQVLDRSDRIELSDYTTDLSLDEIVIKFTLLANSYKEECTKLNRSTKLVNNYYGYDNGYEAEIEVWREENDGEYNARLAHEEQCRQNKLAAEKKKKDKARTILLATETDERVLLAQLQEKYK